MTLTATCRLEVFGRLKRSANQVTELLKLQEPAETETPLVFIRFSAIEGRAEDALSTAKERGDEIGLKVAFLADYKHGGDEHETTYFYEEEDAICLPIHVDIVTEELIKCSCNKNSLQRLNEVMQGRELRITGSKEFFEAREKGIDNFFSVKDISESEWDPLLGASSFMKIGYLRAICQYFLGFVYYVISWISYLSCTVQRALSTASVFIAGVIYLLLGKLYFTTKWFVLKMFKRK